jgi:uncharacterized protein
MEQAALLLKLQEADLEAVRARKRLEEMPEKRAILETRKRLKDLGDLRVKTQAHLDEIDRELARQEHEATKLGEKLESEQSRLMSGAVTNAKEVQNVTKEMAGLQRQKDALENGELKVMEKREKAAQQLGKVDAAIKAAKTTEASRIRDFQTKGGALQTQIQRIATLREKLVTALDADLLARYEKLRADKQGMGVGALEGDTCSACRVGLPATRVSRLQEGAPIGICPACHRLLVVRKDGDQ